MRELCDVFLALKLRVRVSHSVRVLQVWHIRRIPPIFEHTHTHTHICFISLSAED